jgi:hypothetical protein
VRSRFDRLRAEYAAYECDPIGVLRLPALADVTVPSTRRFVEALAEAQALETDAFPGPDAHATGFVAAVERADRAWRAARAAAERIRLSGLSPTERGTVERVIKLLTTARDSDSDAERVAAYSRARSELAKHPGAPDHANARRYCTSTSSTTTRTAAPIARSGPFRRPHSPALRRDRPPTATRPARRPSSRLSAGGVT